MEDSFTCDVKKAFRFRVEKGTMRNCPCTLRTPSGSPKTEKIPIGSCRFLRDQKFSRLKKDNARPNTFSLILYSPTWDARRSAINVGNYHHFF